MRDMIDRYTLVNIIEDMIQTERQKAAEYNAQNPADKSRRNKTRVIYEGALTELLFKIKEV